MFKLNEAPKIVLSSLSTNQTARNCGTFWSILCCLPTVGISVGMCNENRRNSWSCCYPNSISLESDVTLNVLIDKLNQLRVSKEQITKDSNLDERDLIAWQVKETLALLEKVSSDNIIQGSYIDTLKTVYKQIKTQAIQEEQLGHTLDIEKTPLTGMQPYTPNYGMNIK